jgi:hypothetical protein
MKQHREPAAPRLGERFTVAVLAAMAAALGYVRFHLLPAQSNPEPLAFAYRNPMLDAQPGERALFHQRGQPNNQSCVVVREGGLVLRPPRGPERIGREVGLHQSLPYLACTIYDGKRGQPTCGGSSNKPALYGLNYFGMPADTRVRVDSIRPRWVKWGERELVAYEVVFERFGPLSGRWTTFTAEEAPVTGLVKWTRLTPPAEVHYREALDLSD